MYRDSAKSNRSGLVPIAVVAAALLACGTQDSVIQATDARVFADYSTPTVPARPALAYDLGIWHSNVAAEIDDSTTTTVSGVGGPKIDVEIEVLPGKSSDDELIFIYHHGDVRDLSYFEFRWFFLAVKVTADRYHLNVSEVEEVVYYEQPYGPFDPDNENIAEWCRIPWDAIVQFVESNGSDNDDNLRSITEIFVGSFQCVPGYPPPE